MKTIYSLLIFSSFASTLWATNHYSSVAGVASVYTSTAPSRSAATDIKAQQILSQLSQKYQTSGAVKIAFNGTHPGVLWLKGERFYLNCGGVESWFDGKNQWSYVEENEEVTISTPTPEELQSINPFVLLHAAQTAFESRYLGNVKVNGKSGEKIMLTPKTKGDLSSVTLVVSATCDPLSLTVQLSSGESQEFLISSYQTQQNLPDTAFQFPTAKYPHAEVIDMR